MVDHAKIVERLAELRTTAEAAAEDEARGVGTGAGTSALMEHGQDWSPAHSLRWLSWAEQVAAEHHGDFPYDPENGPGNYSWTEFCQECGHAMPCSTLTGLATALGLEET